MELEFVSNGNGLYVASASGVTGCFNVHIETSKPGVATVYMRTAGSAYAKCNEQIEILESDQPQVFCGEGEEIGVVFSKDVKVVSNVPVEKGYITIEEA